VFLAAFHLDGAATDLLPAYDRLMKAYPPDSLDLHICIQREGGVTVYDACPSRADFVAFSTGPEFTAAIAAAGLPRPRIEELGEVYDARMRQTEHVPA
jgi:hypothetical protein